MGIGEEYTIDEIGPGSWIDQIDHVLKSAYRKEAELLGLNVFPPLARTKEDILSCGNRFVGCFAGRELCGVVELERSAVDGRAQTIIASLAVAPAHFRKGIGRALLGFVLERTFGRVRVTTGAGNEPAIRLYESFDFGLSERFVTPDGVEMVAYLGRGNARRETCSFSSSAPAGACRT